MRKCLNWLDTYLKYTDKMESPTNYIIWSGLSAVAACLRRQVYVNMGFFTVYPNMYVVLVGPAGRARKSVALGVALSLVNNLPDIRISADAVTREALIRAIKTSEKVIDIGGGKIYTHSSLTVVSKELSVFLGTGNHDLLSLLTDLYDCGDLWEYRTKNSGIDSIQGVWLNLLGASTPDWLVGSLPLTAIGGGFTSRVIFVVEKDVRRREALPVLTEKELLLRKDLIHDLEQISILVGEMIMDEPARAWFTYWYNHDNAPFTDSRFSGYSERRHVHLIKVAMLLSVCENDKLIIEAKHLKNALYLIQDIEKSMLGAFGATGRNPFAPDIGAVLESVKNVGVMRRSDIVSGIWRDVNTKELSSTIDTLIAMGCIRVDVGIDGVLLYRFVKDPTSLDGGK